MCGEVQGEVRLEDISVKGKVLLNNLSKRTNIPVGIEFYIRHCPGILWPIYGSLSAT